MDIDSSLSSPSWLFDYGIADDIAVIGCNFPAQPVNRLNSQYQPISVSSELCMEMNCHVGKSEKEAGRKRTRCESSSGSKACREKLRRDKINERFVELAYVLEPERPPKTDKAFILNDAIRMVIQLRSETQKLKESNEHLQANIKELKVEKSELREEKQRLKAEKENMEKQIKAMKAQPSFSPASTMAATSGKKLTPMMGYPRIGMWQFMPSSIVDTSQDHLLRPPVA